MIVSSCLEENNRIIRSGVARMSLSTQSVRPIRPRKKAITNSSTASENRSFLFSTSFFKAAGVRDGGAVYENLSSSKIGIKVFIRPKDRTHPRFAFFLPLEFSANSRMRTSSSSSVLVPFIPEANAEKSGDSPRRLLLSASRTVDESP